MKEREVNFEEYCKICKYKDVSENDEPCEECLDEPYNEDSIQPINFKKRG